jgi:hypothetical protein
MEAAIMTSSSDLTTSSDTAGDDTICVYPGCPHSRRTRGLCHQHYQTMRSYVRRGQADEADLVRRGLLLPEGTGGTRAAVGHEAFLKGSKVMGRAKRP